MGYDCNPKTNHMESIFMQSLNVSTLERAHARWNHPQPMRKLLQNQPLCDTIVTNLDKVCRSDETIRYQGRLNHEIHPALIEQPYPWGWKDPRNIFTLPLWLRVFSNARIIYIYRNGIDVAASLCDRQQKEFNAYNTNPTFYQRLKRIIAPFRLMTLEEAFSLWVQYVEMFNATAAKIDQHRIFSLSYEKLVEHPEEQLDALAQFIGLNLDKAEIREITTGVRSERASAFVDDPGLVELYDRKSDHPLMVKLGYSDLVSRLSKSESAK